MSNRSCSALKSLKHASSSERKQRAQGKEFSICRRECEWSGQDNGDLRSSAIAEIVRECQILERFPPPD